MTASWRLGTFRGITIGLHWSMALVFTLLTVSLATAFFPATSPDLPTWAAWLLAAVASVLFFSSILLHELGHSWTALRHGIPVKSITLFILGGVAQITERPKSARVELEIADGPEQITLPTELVVRHSCRAGGPVSDEYNHLGADGLIDVSGRGKSRIQDSARPDHLMR